MYKAKHRQASAWINPWVLQSRAGISHWSFRKRKLKRVNSGEIGFVKVDTWAKRLSEALKKANDNRDHAIAQVERLQKLGLGIESDSDRFDLI